MTFRAGVIGLFGVIAESVPNRTLRTVHERRRGFEDGRQFVDGVFWTEIRAILARNAACPRFLDAAIVN